MKDKLSQLMNDIKAGDIILVRGHSFLSKGIRFFMERYRRKLGLTKRTIFNHAATIIDYKGKMLVAEANGQGIEINAFEKVYGNRLKDIKIISPKKPYSKAERSKISDVAIEDVFNPTRYDFLNFIYQIRMIMGTKVENGKVTKRWAGPKGAKAEKRLYCTEAVATWANDIRPNTFENQFANNPLDVDLNKYYKEIYNGTKA